RTADDTVAPISVPSYERTTPIRVARIITRLNVGGPAIQATLLSERLRAHGFDTRLIYGRLSPDEGDMTYLLNGAHFDRTYIPSLQRSVSPGDDMHAVAAVVRELNAFKPHIV